MAKPFEFSLYYFANDDDAKGAEKYRLLIEGAKLADRLGFHSIWTPERHFHRFGGMFPSPSVVSAALAMITERVRLRAGSVVLPLQNPLRVAEEWAVVDNLSKGRVGISFASGLAPSDFVLAPDSFADRHARMYRDIETVRRLWRGESVTLPDGVGAPREQRTRPSPVQRELPCWVTAATSPDTFRSAGLIGANLLTHVLAQEYGALRDRIAIYRAARREAGHDGPGWVTMLLHTFVHDEVEFVKRTVREPFRDYLRTSFSLLRAPGTVRKDGTTVPPVSAENVERIIDLGYERFARDHALFGTPTSCLDLLGRLRVLDVDEIACFIDFGIDAETTLEGLERLKLLADKHRDGAAAA